MNVRTIAGATALTLALTTAAFAATTAHPMMMKPHKILVSTKCVSLESQFSRAVGHHMKSHWIKTAEKLDAQGTKFCSEGRPVRGAWDLRAALRDIGVAPKA